MRLHAFATAVLVSCLLTGAAQGGEVKNLDWAGTILRSQSAPDLQFVADYADRSGAQHQLQYWREGQARLRRTTDGAVDLMAQRAADGATDYTLIDHRKKVLMHITQDNLYRIGNFTGWDELAHVLAKPDGPYALHKLARRAATIAAYRCAWLQLGTQDGAVRDICWSGALGIPLQIVQGEGAAAVTLWRVTSISTQRPLPEAWRVTVDGYAIRNANDEIDPSSD